METYHQTFADFDKMNYRLVDFCDKKKIEIIEDGLQNKESILLLPPIEATFAAFKYQFKLLSEKYHVISMNYPGYGLSEYSNEINSLEVIADNIAEILKKTCPEKEFNILGWSMGGLLSEIIACNYPGLVKSLMLVNTTSKLDSDDSISSINKMIKALREDYDKYFISMDELTSMQLLKQIKATDNIDISLYYVQCVLRHDYRHKIKNIKAPTLIVAGEGDMLTTMENSKFMHANILGSELHVMKDIGHYIPLLRPTEFNEIIFNWLNAK